jgi:branched-chain amino acid transport system permease protein
LDSVVSTIGNGILVGALYGLIALGLGLISGITKFLNIAHGSFIMLGGYVCFWLFDFFKVDPYLSIPLVIMVMFVVGLLLFILTLSPLLKLPDIGLRINNSLLVTFGVIYVLDNVMTVAWTSNTRSVLTPYMGSGINIFGVSFGLTAIFGLIVAVIVGIALYLLLAKTDFGKHVRAATQDTEAAQLCGINVRRTYLISTGIAVALAGIAGVVIISSYSISSIGGLSWLMIGIVVMVLAGEGNINAIIPAGIILGLVESVSIFFVGAPYRQAVALLIFILVLMFRPQGLFSKGS